MKSRLLIEAGNNLIQCLLDAEIGHHDFITPSSLAIKILLEHAREVVEELIALS